MNVDEDTAQDATRGGLFVVVLALGLITAAAGGQHLHDLARFAARTDRATFKDEPDLEHLEPLLRGHRTVMLLSDHRRPSYRGQLMQRVVTPVAVQPVPIDEALFVRRLRAGEPLILDMSRVPRRDQLLTAVSESRVPVSVTRVDERVVVIVPVGE